MFMGLVGPGFAKFTDDKAAVADTEHRDGANANHDINWVTPYSDDKLAAGLGGG